MNATDFTNEPSALLNDYTRSNGQDKALGMSPEETVMLLVQAAIDKGHLAIACHKSRSLTEKGFHLGRMTSIIDALRDRLNFGYKIAYDLETLYAYIDKCLQKAVFENGTQELEAAVQMLSEIHQAWQVSLERLNAMSA
ncbi:MAG: flagellar protein FliS [Thiotrichales bacterium]|nr:flagellar protein FliS [Thiotrichales bacterium]